MDDWTRVTILEELKTIIVETRGCREDEVVETATLFGDLGLESIDFLEISFRMEESFGFPYPTDELGWIFNAARQRVPARRFVTFAKSSTWTCLTTSSAWSHSIRTRSIARSAASSPSAVSSPSSSTSLQRSSYTGRSLPTTLLTPRHNCGGFYFQHASLISSKVEIKLETRRECGG